MQTRQEADASQDKTSESCKSCGNSRERHVTDGRGSVGVALIIALCIYGFYKDKDIAIIHYVCMCTAVVWVACDPCSHIDVAELGVLCPRPLSIRNSHAFHELVWAVLWLTWSFVRVCN